MMLSPWQARVLLEHVELNVKISDLSQFIDGSVFKELAASEQEILHRQLSTMRQYSLILNERIMGFIK